jgi:YggT family protein
MNGLVVAFDQGLIILRVALFGLGVVAAVVCGIDWLVRTRRVSPFSALARFCRSYVDPLLAPVEGAVVRAGGVPTSAPWWGLVAVVIGSIVVITLVNALRVLLFSALAAAASGQVAVARLLIAWTFQFLQVALLVRVISSWVRVSPWSPWVRWAYASTEWMLRPLRQIVPTMGMIDITPLVAYFILMLLERAILGVF